jgi:hypothetical protein
MAKPLITDNKNLEEINCTEYHYGIVKGLVPWFVILSLFGICVWWFIWPLAAIMGIDAFVVIFRRQHCCKDRHRPVVCISCCQIIRNKFSHFNRLWFVFSLHY